MAIVHIANSQGHDLRLAFCRMSSQNVTTVLKWVILYYDHALQTYIQSIMISFVDELLS